MGQEYRVYRDRIELDFRIFFVPKVITIPFKQVKEISLRPPLVIDDVFRGDYSLGQVLKSIKLDLADLSAHVGIIKVSGFHYRITPDDQ